MKEMKSLLRAEVYVEDAFIEWLISQEISCQKVRGQFRTDDRYSGSKVLWMRVIIRAAFDLASYKNDNRLALRKYADNAHKWLFEKSHLFNSFENICAMLGLNAVPIRNWAASLTKEEVMKMEHLDRRPLNDAFELFERGSRRGMVSTELDEEF